MTNLIKNIFTCCFNSSHRNQDRRTTEMTIVRSRSSRISQAATSLQAEQPTTSLQAEQPTTSLQAEQTRTADKEEKVNYAHEWQMNGAEKMDSDYIKTMMHIYNFIRSEGYEENFKKMSSKEIEKFSQAYNGSVFVHNSNSASLIAFSDKNEASKGMLIPTGQLIEKGLAPFSGTIDVGALSENGINKDSLSAYPIHPSDLENLCSSYEENSDHLSRNALENNSDFNKLKKPSLKERLLNRVAKEKEYPDYRKIITKSFINVLANQIATDETDEALNKMVTISENRHTMYQKMDERERELIDHPFPIIYGLIPDQTEKHVESPKGTFALDTLNKYEFQLFKTREKSKVSHRNSAFNEKMIKDGVKAHEINAIIVPKDKVSLVKEFIGEDFLKENNIHVGSHST